MKKQKTSAVHQALVLLLAFLQSTYEALHTGFQLGPWNEVRRENPESQTFVFRSLGLGDDYDN